MPVSLLAYMMLTRQVLESMRAPSASCVITPDRLGRSSCTSKPSSRRRGARSSIESCSIAESITLVAPDFRARTARARPSTLILLDSVPPDVKKSWCGDTCGSVRAMSSRACSSACALMRPSVCKELGLAPAYTLLS